MATIKMIADSFETATPDAAIVGAHYAKHINGTVQMSIGSKVVTAFAIKHEDNSISVLGFMGQYRTGMKMWRVSMVVRADGNVSAWFGRDDRSGRYNKQQGISWAEEEFFKA